VDGHYSIGCYLEALSGAWRGWRERAMERGRVRWGQQLPGEQLARVLYHVPFCKMARKAHAQLRLCDLEDALGPAPGSPEAREEVSRSQAAYDAQVAGGLWLNAQVGNAYTASLYLALAGLLHREAAALAGQRVGLFSYGSGSCGEFFSGIVGPRASESIARAELELLLAARERIDVAEYERLMALPAHAPEPVAPPPGGFRLTGVEEHRRLYAKG